MNQISSERPKSANLHIVTWSDYGIAALLAVGYVVLLLATAKNLGYARDEGFYFWAARNYENWFQLLATDGSAALEQANVDRYWQANHEHPALMKSLFAFSHQWLFERFQLFKTEGLAYRFPGMLVSSLSLAVVYLWGRASSGRAAGVVGALLLGFMPRVFYHSHLACFDMPVASMWLVTTYAYYRSVTAPPGRGLAWALATAVLYGLLLNTKHNSWLLPAALVGHVVFTRGRHLLAELRAGKLAIPAAFYAMLVIAPVVFYLGWPWIWNDTGARLAEYVAFHTGHEYYNMEFLGETYWKPPMPRAYAWLMTVATVPAITLVLFAVGAFFGLRRSFAQRSLAVLWLLCLLISYAPWLSSQTPIFGGTKHWITAYPFVCLFAGVGFAVVCAKLRTLAANWRVPQVAITTCVAGLVSLGPLVMTLHSHPWGLTFYTPVVGGAPGAASLGLNRTFWGYTTLALAPQINSETKAGSAVFVHDTALQSWDMLRADGAIRPDIPGTLALHASELALYHHEPHMKRVEYQIWTDYRSVQPRAVGTYDGVPVVWLYERPRPSAP